MKRFYLSSLMFFFVFKVFALADLVLLQGSFSPTSLSKCQNLTTTVTIKNIGNATASASTVVLSISETASFTNAPYLSRATVKQLNVNESVTVEFVYPIASTFISSLYYVGVIVDVYDDVQEINESNSYRLNGTFNLSDNVAGILKTPYPIIFIHGLLGNSGTWDYFTDLLDQTYGWSYGGKMDFCLNADGNKYTSNFTSDYKDFTALQNNLSVGDYYYVNFAVDVNGNYNPDPYVSQSNQSAIFKQGRAIRDAIKYVRQKTGSNKVILVGHSMGGVASREYLQNMSIWQSDGQHHVAKLFTIGTPHGGSNFSSLGLNIFDKIDEKSEAVRDLRYTLAPYVGRYLFGGTETTVSGFNSDDINCNGVVGDAIVGLNNKSIPTNIFYTCTIGTGALLGGDGVVASDRANINNYPSIIGVEADTFRDRTYSSTETHTQLHQNLKGNMKGLDEPYEYGLSYEISTNKLYYGFITQQSETSSFQWDYDDYKFTTTQKGSVRIKIYNIPVHNFQIDLLDANQRKVIPTIVSNSRGNIDTIINLNTGSYFFEIAGSPTSLSYFFPYAFRADFTPNTGTQEILNNVLKSQINPNPLRNLATLNFNLPENSLVKVKLYNSIGQQVKELELGNLLEGLNEVQIDASELTSGIYIYTIQTNKNIESKQFIIQK